jgi:hypothetical protein
MTYNDQLKWSSRKVDHEPAALLVLSKRNSTLVKRMNEEHDGQLQRPLPSPASFEPSAIGVKPAIDDMLMTRPGSWLVESLAKRGVNPTVTGRGSNQQATQNEESNTNHKIYF